MEDISVDRYMAATTTPPQPVVKAQKRKRDHAETNTELKQKARLLCRCSEQWKIVSRYSDQRLMEFVQERTFEQQQQLYNTVFGFAHTLWALSMDIILKGNGFVKQQIENDLSLRQAIEEEGVNFVSFLNNRCKFMALTAVDCFNGKRQQIILQPEPLIVQEESDDRSGEKAAELDTITVQSTVSGETPIQREDCGEGIL
jgi:hypothetical protein